MWQLLNQYGWLLLLFGMMILMYRRGMGGCCGGHQRGSDYQRHQYQKGMGGCCGGHKHGQENHNDQPVTKKPIHFEPKQ